MTDMAEVAAAPASSSQRPKPLLTSLFGRRLSGECASVALGVFAVLFGIIVTAQLVRLLNRAASGRIAADTVVAAMSFQTLNVFPLVLALTIFVAALVALTRAHRDSEMVVWFSCGVPLRAFVVPLLRFALPFVALVALLSLVVRPWAVTRSQELQSELQSRDEIALIAPGVFKETRSGSKVYFVERFSDFNQTLAGLFIRAVDPRGESIISTRAGNVERAASGDLFLVLRDGYRYESSRRVAAAPAKPAAGDPGRTQAGGAPKRSAASEGPAAVVWRMTRFERAEILIQPYEKQAFGDSAKARGSLELLASDRRVDIAELQWRMHMPVAALLLVLLAVPLGFVNPRARRSVNLVLAVLIYAVYSNALSISNAWVAQGRIAPWPGFLLVHLALAAVILILLAWQTGAFVRWRRRT